MNTIKTPILLNAAQIAAEHPDTFTRPDRYALDHLKPGVKVKVAILRQSSEQVLVDTSFERFWVEITETALPLLTGRIVNYLRAPFCGIDFDDDLIRFHTDNIYCIHY